MRYLPTSAVFRSFIPFARQDVFTTLHTRRDTRKAPSAGQGLRVASAPVFAHAGRSDSGAKITSAFTSNTVDTCALVEPLGR